MDGATGSHRERRARADWVNTESTKARRANPGSTGQANPAGTSGIVQTTRAVNADRVGAE